MPEFATRSVTENRLAAVSQLLSSGTIVHARRMMKALHPSEIASLLESVPMEQRLLLWDMVDPKIEGDVLTRLGDEVRASLVRTMDLNEIIAATESLDLDDMADFIQSLPERLTERTLNGMDQQNRVRLESVLQYPEDCAGGLMDTNTVTVRADVELDVVLRYLRLKGELPDHFDSLYVVNRFGRYRGVLTLNKLLTHDPDFQVVDVMIADFEAIPAETKASEVARLFEDHDLISAPVVDDQGMLLGRITVDDIVDIIREEGEQSVMNMAGLSQEDDIFSSPVRSARKRAFWLGLNLMTAFLASWVIGHFEAALEKIVALAILMSIVPSMGGIAGSQTLTLVIRGQATGQVGIANTRWLLSKELLVGLFNGILWALVVAGIVFWWFGDYQIGIIIGAALIINLLAAALVGVIIPFVLRKLGVDPAIAGGVLLTTITDVTGVVAFLGMATLFLLN